MTLPYFAVDGFLDAGTHDALLRAVIADEARFVAATVSTRIAEYRQAKVLFAVPPFALAALLGRITRLVPAVLRDLGLAAFPLGDIECQVTAHGAGHYFRVHNDNGSPDTATRELSYAYYFFAQPQGFSGGVLRLHHGAGTTAVVPRDNRIVFFPSRLQHEVCPVSCPSGRFADSRFTLNGWIRRQV